MASETMRYQGMVKVREPQLMPHDLTFYGYNRYITGSSSRRASVDTHMRTSAALFLFISLVGS
jgi:hypothetical protein